ncbi:jg12806 [Pararge aegeria aegeria]|uniref:Jg12806 protein n=1 Tax=Pararge aegeria aegeria TaxID=348720 RepID=A0A8S4RLC4_9NEOP|nr:jg12806 [Pararge aegeria aegeria]
MRGRGTMRGVTEAQVAREGPPSPRGKAAPTQWHSICDDNLPIYVFGHGWRPPRPYGVFQSIMFFNGAL